MYLKFAEHVGTLITLYISIREIREISITHIYQKS